MSRHADMARPDRARPRPPAGWSLLEVIIAIGVIAILIGLALPTLGRSRERARTLQSAANLGSIGRIISTYAAASDDQFPVGETGRFYPASLGQGITKSYDNIFEFGRAWPVVVRPIVPWSDGFEVYFSPLVNIPPAGSDATGAFSYPLTHSVPPPPGLWRLGADPDKSLLGGRRVAELAYPASKAVSWDGAMRYLIRPVRSARYPSFLSNPTPILFGDGHADERLVDDATPPVANIMNPVTHQHLAPLHNTPLGVLGRDFE